MWPGRVNTEERLPITMLFGLLAALVMDATHPHTAYAWVLSRLGCVGRPHWGRLATGVWEQRWWFPSSVGLSPSRR